MGRGSSRRRGGRGSGRGNAEAKGGGGAAPPNRPPNRPPAGADDGEHAAADGSDRDSLMAMSGLHLWQFQIVRDLVVIAAVLFVLWIGYALRAVTVPLLVALLLAYLFEPLVSRIAAHRRFSREGAVMLLLVSVLGLVLVVGGALTPLVVQQSTQLARDVRSGNLEASVLAAIQNAPQSPSEFVDQLRGLFADEKDAGSEDGEEPDGDAGGDADADGDADGDAGGDDVAEDGGAVVAAGAGPGDDNQPDRAEGAATAVNPDGGSIDAAPSLVVERLLDEVLTARGGDRLDPAERERLRGELEGLIPAPVTDDELDRRIRDAIAQTPLGLTDPNASGGRAGGVNYFGLLRSSVSRVTGFLGAIVQAGLLTFLIPFYFYYFSVCYPRIVKFIASMVPNDHRKRAFDLAARMDVVVAGFVRGRIVISMLMGVLFAIGWWIAGVPYAIPIGLIVGIFSAVPYLGVVGIPLSVGLVLFDQYTMPAEERMAVWLMFAGPIAVFAIVQLIEGYILTPMIAGRATNLDPVTILVVVLAGGSTLGVYGMLLAIPVAACGKILLTEVLMPRIDAWIRGEAKDPLPLDR